MRWRLPTVALALLAAAGGRLACGPGEGRYRLSPRPPSPHVVQAFGYDEAVHLGTAYAQQLGYPKAVLKDASQYGSNVWRVRFGIGHGKEGDRTLQLYFDGARRQLIKVEEQAGVGGRFENRNVSPMRPGNTP